MLRIQDPGEVRLTHRVSSHSSVPGFAVVVGDWDDTRTRWEVRLDPKWPQAPPIQFTHEPNTYLPDGSLDELTDHCFCSNGIPLSHSHEASPLRLLVGCQPSAVKITCA